MLAWTQAPFFEAVEGCHLYNFCGSLRTLKGFVCGVLLFAPMREALGRSPSGYALLAAGVLLGLFAESLALGVERILFTGLWDFDVPFRVTGTFSSLHTGGQHRDACLAMTMPFIALSMMVSHDSRTLNRVLALLGFMLFVLTVYAVLVTVSRGLIVAVMVCCFILAVGGTRVRHSLRRTRVAGSHVLVTSVLLLAMLGASFNFVLGGPYFSHRFANVSVDFSLRSAHWRHVLSMTGTSTLQRLFGSGLASYAPTYARAGSVTNRLATFVLRNEEGEHSIRLRGGHPVYFEQRLDVAPHTPYRSSIDLVTSHHNTILVALLCEKSLRYSARCARTAVGPVPVPVSGQRFSVDNFIHSRQVGDTRGERLAAFVQRPVTLALLVPRQEDVADIDNVKLLAPDGTVLIHNGDFEAGTERWFSPLTMLAPGMPRTCGCSCISSKAFSA
ncbi:MAG: hypothetical protein ACI9DC_000251 [Gammaproteobacteria bacterium]|jgi:hypothetical protein